MSGANGKRLIQPMSTKQKLKFNTEVLQAAMKVVHSLEKRVSELENSMDQIFPKLN